MKILQLCKKTPFPPKDGEAIAILTLTKGFYAAGQEVQVLAMNTPKHAFVMNKLPTEIKQIAKFESIFVDTSLSVVDAFFNLFSKKSYNIQRFDNQDYRKRLIEILQKNEFDIIQLEGVYLATYIDTIRQYSNAKIVMRSHNVESEIWQRLAAESSGLKAIYLRFLAKRMLRFEIESLQKYDGLVCISAKDEAYFVEKGYQKPKHTLAVSLNLKDYALQSKDIAIQKSNIFFIGSLDWLPNQTGLIWFLEDVWPRILNDFPQAHFKIAGRNIPDWIKEKTIKHVEILGEVESAIDFMQNNDIMIVPLFSGSGMRVKIIEAMALAKPIVATTLAAEGITYTHQKNIVIADDATTFAAHLLKLLKNKSLGEEIGRNARLFVEQEHENKVLIRRLLAFYEGL